MNEQQLLCEMAMNPQRITLRFCFSKELFQVIVLFFQPMFWFPLTALILLFLATAAILGEKAPSPNG